MNAAYCIQCGAELAADHRFCPRCGAERWTPAGSVPDRRPPPSAGTQPFHPAPPKPDRASRLRWLPFVFAAGAVFWLVQLAQFAAVVTSSGGQDELRQAALTAGITVNVTTVLVIESAFVIGFEVAAAGLHAAAYFGLRARRPWGWIAGVIAAAGWSLVIIGIPILVVMLRRETRHIYGM